MGKLRLALREANYRDYHNRSVAQLAQLSTNSVFCSLGRTDTLFARPGENREKRSAAG